MSTHSCQQLCINSDGSYGCDCEEGYALNSDGRTCSISCGGNYTANSGSFHSPGWPDHYPLNFRCEWYIYPENSSSNTTLSLTVDDSNYGIHGTAPCSRDYLEFYDGNTTSATLLERFCGLTTPGIQYASSSQAVVVFNSVNIHQQSSRAGAKITYQLFELGMYLNINHSLSFQRAVNYTLCCLKVPLIYISSCAVDECLIDNGGCEQICQNTALSFSCHCDEGYALRADGRSCDGNDSKSKLITTGAIPLSVESSIPEYQPQGDQHNIQKRNFFSIFSCSLEATLTSCYNQCLQRAAYIGT